MRIGVHLESLRPGQIGGMERYVRAILDGIPRIAPEVTWVLACAPYNIEALPSGPHIERHVLEPEDFRRLDADTLRSWRLDLWFCPLLVVEPETPGLPTVVTVPDLQHETHPAFFTDEVLAWRRRHYGRSVQMADRVLTLSSFSRDEIVSRFALDPGAAAKVVAVPLDAEPTVVEASPTTEVSEVRSRFGLDGDFVLYPANLWPHKDHDTVVRALASLHAARGTAPTLVLTGAADGAPEALARWSDAHSELDIRHLGYVSPESLAGLYRAALALAFPSRFEGFGLPIVEAMRCGCPVVCSNATSLPEVAGDAAWMFAPGDDEALAASLGRLLDDPEEGDRLRRAGARRAERFSWQRTCEQTWSALRSAARAQPGLAEVMTWPRLTVVTPSFEQGAFIGRTIESVLAQGYPHLEHLVVDGGSTDETTAVVEGFRRRYPSVMRYVSEPDRGQAHAVNKGLSQARGDVMGWLNSDDVYLPGAFDAVIEAFREGDEGWLYGRARYLDADDGHLDPYPVQPTFDWHALAHVCFLCQPAVFWRPAHLQGSFLLDENLHTCLDYDLWIRMGRENQPRFVDAELAGSRLHTGIKTLRDREGVYDEIVGTVRRHFGYVPLSWAVGRAHHDCQPDDDPLRPGPVRRRTLALAAWLLVRYNLRSPAALPRTAGDLRRLLGELTKPSNGTS